jgi:hypothetical protein
MRHFYKFQVGFYALLSIPIERRASCGFLQREEERGSPKLSMGVAIEKEKEIKTYKSCSSKEASCCVLSFKIARRRPPRKPNLQTFLP